MSLSSFHSPTKRYLQLSVITPNEMIDSVHLQQPRTKTSWVATKGLCL